MSEKKYELKEMIGKGGQGSVYACHSKKEPSKRFAMKRILNTDFDEANDAIQELMVIRKLIHPNITNYYDMFLEKKDEIIIVCIVMELFTEGDLFQLVDSHYKDKEKGLPLSEDVVRAYLTQICDTALYLHSEGIIHRDLKPQNIFIMEKYDKDDNPYNLLKIGDFGLSTSNYSVHNTFVGTGPYIAPELLRGQNHNESIDMYAVGCLAFFLCTGKEETFGINLLVNPNEVWKKLREQLVKERGYSESLVNFVIKLLNPDPTKRMTAKEAVQYLKIDYLTKKKTPTKKKLPKLTWEMIRNDGKIKGSTKLPKISLQATCTYNGVVYLHGGTYLSRKEIKRGSPTYCILYSLDLSEKSPYFWTKVSSSASKKSPSRIRRSHAMVACNHALYVVGGVDSTCFYSDIYKFDLELKKWVEFDSRRLTPVHGHCLTSWNDRYIVLFGGAYPHDAGGYKYHSHLMFLDTENPRRWVRKKYTGKITKRAWHSCSIVGKNLLIFGGSNGTDILGDLHMIDLEELIATKIEVKSPISPPVVGGLSRFGEFRIRQSSGKMTVFLDRFVIVHTSMDWKGKSQKVSELFVFDLQKGVWKLVRCTNKSHDGSGNHGAFEICGNKFVLIGGKFESLNKKERSPNTSILVWKNSKALVNYFD